MRRTLGHFVAEQAPLHFIVNLLLALGLLAPQAGFAQTHAPHRRRP